MLITGTSFNFLIASSLTKESGPHGKEDKNIISEKSYAE